MYIPKDVCRTLQKKMEENDSTNATIHTHDDDGEPEVNSKLLLACVNDPDQTEALKAGKLSYAEMRARCG